MPSDLLGSSDSGGVDRRTRGRASAAIQHKFGIQPVLFGDLALVLQRQLFDLGIIHRSFSIHPIRLVTQPIGAQQ